jgi:hypothetical protein
MSEVKTAFDGIFKVNTAKLEESRKRSNGSTKAKEKREREGDPTVRNFIRSKKEKSI